MQPARKAQQKLDTKPVYPASGSHELQDIETRAVLQLLADASGRTSWSPIGPGSVTLRLQNVPWDRHSTCVAYQRLDKRRNDNVIIVAPTKSWLRVKKPNSPPTRTFRIWRRCAPNICR